MRSILAGLLLIPALWGQGKHWAVSYLADPFELLEGQVITLEVCPDRLVLDGGRVIPVEAIADVGYQRVRFQRFQPLVGPGGLEYVSTGGGEFGPALAAFLFLANTLVEKPHGIQHRIIIIWYDAGQAKRLTLEASKGEYRDLLASLAKVAGRPWKYFDTPSPQGQVRDLAPVGPADQEAVLRAVQASLRRTAPVPAHLAPER